MAPRFDALYFGCWGAAGHYLRDINGGCPSPTQLLPPSLHRMDGMFAPDLVDQPEGLAALHHVDGWTVLAFWDRSADRRRNSNSVFLLRGTHDFDAAVTCARGCFPTIWTRFRFPVVLWQRPVAIPCRRCTDGLTPTEA